MEDWKIRLVNEQIELKERIKKLAKFLKIKIMKILMFLADN